MVLRSGCGTAARDSGSLALQTERFPAANGITLANEQTTAAHTELGVVPRQAAGQAREQRPDGLLPARVIDLGLECAAVHASGPGPSGKHFAGGLIPGHGQSQFARPLLG